MPSTIPPPTATTPDARSSLADVPASALRGRNRVAEAFYNGPGWRRFRFWERLFLKVQGGETRARRQILKHLPSHENAKVLEVGIGDGANLSRLPRSWSVLGVDIASRQLDECLSLHPFMSGRLTRAEGECLPFPDEIFDACFSIGGFNHFRDHPATLTEMRRVTRPGGTLIVADEIPDLHRFGIGHLIGFKPIDAWWLGSLGLDRDFIQMIFDHKFDPERVVREHWPGAARHSIWFGLGYCYVSTRSLDPSTKPRSPS